MLVCQGVTFRIDNGELVIARILHGGMIDQQGLLHVGDIIKEVNGRDVGDDPRVLQEMLQEASVSVVLKILPSYQEPHPPRQVPCSVYNGTCSVYLHAKGISDPIYTWYYVSGHQWFRNAGGSMYAHHCYLLSSCFSLLLFHGCHGYQSKE